ncbi:MAG: hypothetical protein A2508_08435 [Candidatus Lambdaproteobacteria bacterium RIFOXYD12_FULL_49_8]|nr:MAG: hypothetical protein A2508_08435 [Candidatus Lambdaproteobacteria bacterium RIFOXYD12_FULL_49_8]
MAKVFILLIGLLLCGQTGWAKKPVWVDPIAAKAPWMDQLYVYLEHDAFNSKKCKAPDPSVVCGAREEKLELFAESDGQDGFVLNIKERESDDKMFRLRMVRVRFSQREGIVLTDVTDFYDNFPRVMRNTDVPIVVRRWLMDIQKSLRSDYPFPPLRE